MTEYEDLMEMSSKERMFSALRDYLEESTQEERVEFFNKMLDGYCPICGTTDISHSNHAYETKMKYGR